MLRNGFKETTFACKCNQEETKPIPKKKYQPVPFIDNPEQEVQESIIIEGKTVPTREICMTCLGDRRGVEVGNKPCSCAKENQEETKKDIDKDSWNTPLDLALLVKDFFGGEITLDPCSNEFSILGATINITKEENGLSVDWVAATKNRGSVFLNPPFTKSEEAELWIDKTIKMVELSYSLRSKEPSTLESEFQAIEVIAVLPVRGEQSFFQKALKSANRVCFPQKRIKYTYQGKTGCSPEFASALFYWGRKRKRFEDMFSAMGAVLMPA